MRRSLLSLIPFLCAAAEPWSLEKLYTRPFAWGTSPEQAVWSKQNHTLLFLWNHEGRRFLDLYAYHPDQQKLMRLTKLESVPDDLNRNGAEKDERRRLYLMPPEGLSGFDVSRDGARAAFSYRGDLYLVSTGGSQPPLRLTRTKAVESGPRLSPEGNRIAFARDRQLYVQDLKTGQIWQVTELEGAATELGRYRWAPAGTHLFFTVRQGSGRQVVLPNYSGRVVTARDFERSLPGDEPFETSTFVVSAEGGSPKRMEPGPWGEKVWEHSVEWSPDSKKLLQSSIHPKFKQRQVLVSHAASGKSKVVFSETDEAWVEPLPAGWSPDSNQVWFVSERDGWAHLYKIPAQGGDHQQITRGAWEVHSDHLMFSPVPQWIGESIYYTSSEVSPAERHFYRIRPDGSGKEKLSSKEGINIGVASEDGRYIAMMRADLNNPFDLYVGDRRVTTSPLPEFSSYPWPETHFVSFPSRRDHRAVAAKLLLPPGYRLDDRRQKPKPAIFFIHGSGYATSVLKQWGSYYDLRFVFNCYLASRGYVVLDLDYRGSSGYGRDWRAGVYLHMGGPDLDDVLGGIDYLRELGNIDMRRLGIWGVSYGGFLTNMAMFQEPDVFRAGVAWAAVNDWENYNAYYTGQRLTTPEENPEAYRRSSPVHFSSRLKNPLLVVHGMVDNNVLFQDAVQLTEKLIHEGKDFSQIYYPEENHSFVRDETLIDAFRRTADWMDRHLR